MAVWDGFKARLEQDDAPKWNTPGDLAKHLTPETIQTPALDLIDAALVEAFNTPDARLIITMPPQEGKTTRVSRDFPSWVLSLNPETRIQAASYGDDLARDNGSAVRERMKALGKRISRDKNSAGNWQLAGHRGGMRSVSLGGGFSGHPADLIIIDDPIKSETEADSKAYRERVWKFWRSEAVARLAPGTMVVIILTRWHQDDLAGRLLKEAGSTWKVLNIPAQANHDPAKGQVDVLGRQPGEFMRSARINKDGRPRTREQWEQRKREVGSRMWQAQYQGSPVQDEGNIVHRDWWRKYSTPLWVDRADGSKVTLGVEDQLIISCDLTFKGTTDSDFVVLQVWLRRGIYAYLLDQERGQWNFPTTCDKLEALARRWPQAILKIVEDAANGPAVIAQLANTVPGLVPETPQGSKPARLAAVSPFIEAGNVWIPDPETFGWAWIDDYIDELAAFPSGSHDDQVDATSQALNRLLVQPFVDGSGFGPGAVAQEPEEFSVLDEMGWTVSPY